MSTRSGLSLRSISSTLAVTTASLVAVSVVSAQAWVPPKNTGTFDLTYARATATLHLFRTTITVAETGETGKAVDYGDEYSNIAVLSFDYGISDRLAVRADISSVSSKYVGIPAWQEGALDDGEYHGTLTDFRAEVRYAALQKKNLVLTPFLGLVVPTHDYVSEGHAAPGRGLTQIPAGVGFGYTWPRQIHTTYFQARYSYSYLTANDYDFARSNAFVEAGTFLARWCSIRGVIGAEKTHGGIHGEDIDTAEEFEFHDARLSSRYLSAAAGVSFAVSRSVSLSASYSEILEGADVVNAHTFWVSATWYFGGAAEKLIGKSR